MKSLLAFILIFQINICYPQILPGARQTALSNADIANGSNLFNIEVNPAGLNGISGTELGVFYSPSPFGMKELSTGYAVFSYGFENLRLSLGYSNYGFELYKENTLYFSAGKNLFNNFSAGISLSLTNISIKNYGNTNVFRINCGTIYSVRNDFNIAFSIQNLTNSKVKNDSQPLPVIYNFGLAYSPVKDISLNLAAEKEVRFNTSLHFGIEFIPIEFIALRTGIANEPDTFSGGAGIFYSRFNFSYAFKNHNELGITHQIELIYKITEQ
ncbi:MAG: hypothetical protein GXX85_12130 [Ignavibacteria bacterium]|nr:hypothetical protein [Ignavibacteria bacterium]